MGIYDLRGLRATLRKEAKFYAQYVLMWQVEESFEQDHSKDSLL